MARVAVKAESTPRGMHVETSGPTVAAQAARAVRVAQITQARLGCLSCADDIMTSRAFDTTREGACMSVAIAEVITAFLTPVCVRDRDLMATWNALYA